jgi:hypothetical protein
VIGRGTSCGGSVARVVALAIGVLAALPAFASAAPRSLPAPGAFKLQGSNGYTVEFVAAQAGAARPSEVGLVVSKSGASAIYFGAGRVTPTSFEADFGALGKVAVTYRPTGGSQLIIPGCADVTTLPKEVSFPKGVYEGTIEFHGEGAFTDLSATSAPGSFPELRCGSYSETGGSRVKGIVLDASPSVGADGSGFSFSAVKNHPGGPVAFKATALEAIGDIGILRSVRIKAPSRTFRFSAARGVATVRPSAPFSGSARWAQQRGKPATWRGDLAVDFPGRPHVQLTGSGVEARLRHAEVHETEL